MYSIKATVGHVNVRGKDGGVSTTITTAPQPGFVAMGTAGFYPAQFDDFHIMKGTSM